MSKDDISSRPLLRREAWPVQPPPLPLFSPFPWPEKADIVLFSH
jgi:hypothetical protein